MGQLIVLNSLWRTQSTYWWSKFREDDTYRAFYEPFHYSHIKRTNSEMERAHNSRDKAQTLRHRPEEQHYFAEFPIKPEGGVGLFQARFVLSNFALRANEEDPELKAYFESLVELAESEGKIPLFKPCRGFLRGAWMKANLGGTHIFLTRHPEQIFNSAYDYVLNPREGGLNAFSNIVTIVSENRDHPLFAPLLEAYDIPKAEETEYYAQREHYKQVFNENLSKQDLQDLVGFIWFTGMGHATRYADLIIDANLMANPDYRQTIKHKVNALTGAEIDLDDYKHHEIPGEPYQISDKMINIMRQVEPLLEADWTKLEGGVIAPQSLDLVKNCRPQNSGPQRRSKPSEPKFK